jgi:hypothetical protein
MVMDLSSGLSSETNCWLDVVKKRVVINDQRARCSLGEHREGRVEIILGTGPRDYYLLT